METAKQLRKIKYQIIPIAVTSANAIETSAVVVDQNYQNVVGVQVTTTAAAALAAGVFDKFEIGSKEVYPKGFELKMINSGQDVAVNERFDKEIDEPGEGATINITYRDPAYAANYTIYVYLKLKNPTK